AADPLRRPVHPASGRSRSGPDGEDRQAPSQEGEEARRDLRLRRGRLRRDFLLQARLEALPGLLLPAEAEGPQDRGAHLQGLRHVRRRTVRPPGDLPFPGAEAETEEAPPAALNGAPEVCTLVLSVRPQGPWPLLLAATRDELRARAWEPPAEWWPE